jgi:2-polyprenyl-3-methyl-5-hydroxy-6-metoxy-1,4-benzoquinol methylase
MRNLNETQRYERAFFNARLREALKRDPQYGLSRISLKEPLHTMAVDPVFFGFLGDVKGKTLLDICCGTGRSSILAAMGGAERVTGIDLSALTLDIARRNAALNGVAERIEFREMAVEDLDFPDQSFDLIMGVDALHHTDLQLSLFEISRVLRDRGKGVFVETSALNPVMMLARRYLTGHFGIQRCRNQTEHPLTRGDFALMARAFSRVQRVGTSLLFELRRLPLLSSWEGRLHHWDEVLFSALPWLRDLCYYQVIEVIK